MKTALLLELEKKIDEFFSEQSEGDNWPEFFITANIGSLMARAAASVMDACQEGQDTIEAENE